MRFHASSLLPVAVFAGRFFAGRLSPGRLSTGQTLLVTTFLIGACQSPVAPAARTLKSRSSTEAARHDMVESVIRGAGVTNEGVLLSMLNTERHRFVPVDLQDRAYVDAGLPIGEGQTISSPFIVAYMTQALEPQATDRVLEIGTGSGYQAAVLSPLVQEVYSIEIVEALGKRAAEVLGRLGYSNVHTKVGDGYLGWEEHAPFDKIVVTCSPEDVPAPLVEQLAEGGMIVVPVGERHQQVLYRMVKKDGELVATSLRPTLFVPMTGAAEARRRVLPDAAHPAILNADFEDGLDENAKLRGWYYQRGMRLVESASAPSGERYIEFFRDAPGQPAHVMQALAIDGREVSRLDFRAMTSSSSARAGAHPKEVPTAGLTFYDEDRLPLDTVTLGPMLGTNDWQERVRHHIHVPSEAREAIVRIGLFGATGSVSFDDVQVIPVDAAGRPR